MTASQSASLIRASKPSRVMPALFTRISNPPSSAITPLTVLSIAAPSALLHAYALTLPPAFRASSTICAAASTFEAYVNATVAPSAASRFTIALPMPRDPPVTIAIFPARVLMIFYRNNFFYYFSCAGRAICISPALCMRSYSARYFSLFAS
ncbi:MAG TPA: hypothetical protein VFJ29_00505 [Candidatus Kapabacteria bacterium]|nr:hypothetical protein [Candidatus Kapabacteria bacterium]